MQVNILMNNKSQVKERRVANFQNDFCYEIQDDNTSSVPFIYHKPQLFSFCNTEFLYNRHS